ncbi:MAG: glycosyl transferase family [Bacteroidetes bacterium]|nr:MAG: glycosyl transferase family [Bacteroidota bacterium]
MNEDRIKVSVCMITYNHEFYIKQAIEGVLMQKCNFDFELVIGEDCSSDGTRNICEKYAVNNNHIRLLGNENNLGVMPNFIRSLQACKAKYIALCEGDDYWTDPLKLQKQVNFLEANPAYSLCFHNAIIKHEGKQAKDELYFKNKISDNIDIKKIIAGHGMPTASMLFKKDALEIPFWLNYVYNGDYAIRLILATKGTIGYLDELMTVYRKQPGGLNATMVNAKVHQHIIVLLSYFNIYTNFKYNDLIIERINSKFKEYPFELIRDKSRLYRFLSIAYWEHRLGKTFKF